MLLGALLLFSLEPFVGRSLLPSFGGGFQVWTTSLMFFQGVLFLAYLYAHFLAPRIGGTHLLLVLLACFWLPPAVGVELDSPDGSVLAILVELSARIAVPFFVLATSAVLAQSWWANSATPRGEPWGLYAVSNAGSLIALIVYVTVIEPFVGLRVQARAWAGGFALYVLAAFGAWWTLRPTSRRVGAVSTDDEPFPRSRVLYWTLLSAAPSAFLMAVTNLIALDAGNLPLVWVVPLAIYLGSFILAFAEPSRVPLAVRRLWPFVGAVGVFFFSGGEAGGGWIDVLIQLVVLGFVTSAAHAELHRTRPPAAHLTKFYSVVAFGGWLGGAFVALGAPAWFTGLWEYPLALFVLVLAFAIARRVELTKWIREGTWAARLITVAFAVTIIFKVIDSGFDDEGSTSIDVRRSPYGLYRVAEWFDGDTQLRDLISGHTRHGRQRVGQMTPLSYYHRAGPLGDVFDVHPPGVFVGAVGLGVGAAAGHLESGDRVRFFEIDMTVSALARRHFTFLSGSAGEVEVIVADARLALEEERRAGDLQYSFLLIDAFSGDAIPTHLLTIEAMQLYLTRVEEGGVVLFHVSNRYYDLRPVLASNAERLELFAAQRERRRNLERDEDPSQYVAVAARAERIERLIAEHGWTALRPSGSDVWTDDRASLLGALAIE